MNHANEVKPMYPGIYPPPEADRNADELGLPTAPLNTLLGFDMETYQVPLEQLLPLSLIHI